MGRGAFLLALFTLSLITYIDRAAISSVKDSLSTDIGLDNQQIGMVFSAFALGYALTQIPFGWLADRAGARLLLSAVVLAWSILTAITGLLNGFFSLLMVRFLFGVAEAGAFPGAARAIYEGLPASQRGLGNGFLFAGSRLGAALAFPLMGWLLTILNWRTIFLALAVPGILWAAVWFLFYRKQPLIQRAGASAELGISLRSRPVALAMTQYFIVNFTTFLALSWMQPYLKQTYSLGQMEAGYYAMIPLILGAGAQWGTGAVGDALYRNVRYRWLSRRLPAISGFLISAFGVAFIASAGTIQTAVLWFSVAAVGAEMVIGPSWAYCMDIGGPRSATVSGAMNMAGNFGSFVCANLFPLLTTLTGSSAAYFWMVLALDLVAAACWLGMRPSGLPANDKD